MADFKPSRIDSYLKWKWPPNSTKRQRLSDWIKKQDSTICYPQKPTLNIKSQRSQKKKIYNGENNSKKIRVATHTHTHTLNIVVFRTRSINGSEEGKIHQESII